MSKTATLPINESALDQSSSSDSTKAPAVSRAGHIRVRPTAGGIGYLVLAFIGLLMGINYSNNLIYALAYLLFAFALISFWQTRQQVAGLKQGTWHTQAVFSGQVAQWQQQLTKQRGQPVWGLFAHNDLANEHYPLHLKQGETKTIKYEMKTSQRGFLKPAAVSICSTYPFGLFRACLSTENLPECVVYPVAKGALPLPVDASSTDAHRHLESETLASLRKYTAGDNLRRVSWKALARTDELMTKEFDGAEGDPALWLDFNSIDHSFEDRLSQLSRWILDAEQKGLEYGVRLNAKEIEPGLGEVHRNTCLKELALYGLEAADDDPQRSTQAGL